MNRYLNTNNIADCCGCAACVQSCPTLCLKMTCDPDGFLHPMVEDTSKCIDCSLCAKVCPVENRFETSYKNSYYGAYNEITGDIDNSSSGGIFPALARWVIGQEGVVYGAYLDGEHNLYHIRIADVKEITKQQSSKYFQSDIKDTYITCKKDLQEGRKVLFSGTPCQVQGLKLFLRKEYENLFTADVICHGVPSRKMFAAYVEYLEKKHGGKLVDINFRDKKRNGWSITLRYTIEYSDRKRKDYYRISKLSEYFMAFLSGSIARESCYSCQYSSMNRPGDITMGDFWGYQNKRPELRHDKGLSLIIVNSSRGERIVNLLKEIGVIFIEVDEDCVAASENKNLYYPTKRPTRRDTVYEELEEYGFDHIAQKYFRKSRSLKNLLKNYLPPIVVNLFKNRE